MSGMAVLPVSLPQRARNGVRGGVGVGFRRVDLVRFVIDDHGRWAELIGASHRVPRRQQVPFRLGVRLARAGVPCQVDDRRSPGAMPLDSLAD
jgi:hypothetical protein